GPGIGPAGRNSSRPLRRASRGVPGSAGRRAWQCPTIREPECALEWGRLARAWWHLRCLPAHSYRTETWSVLKSLLLADRRKQPPGDPPMALFCRATPSPLERPVQAGNCPARASGSGPPAVRRWLRVCFRSLSWLRANALTSRPFPATDGTPALHSERTPAKCAVIPHADLRAPAD